MYATSQEIVGFIASKLGKPYTCTGLVPLLYQLGFSYKKTKLVPCEVDVVHPPHNTKSAYAWIEKGQEKEILYETLKDSTIKQLFLPPYSPNLNLIERLWKFLRKKVIHHHFYREFGAFKKAIFNFFENMRDFKAELETLISWNFHIPNTKPIKL